MTVRFITCTKCFRIDHVQGFIQCPKCGTELCKGCASGTLKPQECALSDANCTFARERLEGKGDEKGKEKSGWFRWFQRR